MEKISFDLNEKFPVLSKAPVTEAVLEIRGLPSVDWEEGEMTPRFQELYPEFPQVQSKRQFVATLKFTPNAAPQHEGGDRGWLGLDMRDKGGTEVLRLMAESFGYSRLAPYPGWEAFQSRSLQLWDRYQQQVGYPEISRIGLRYISLLPLPREERIDLDDYLVHGPKTPVGLNIPHAGFLHADTYHIPGTDYQIQFTRTVKPLKENMPESGFGLLLDLDVYSTGIYPTDQPSLLKKLLEMRWLKNKVFFGSLTPHIIDQLK